MSEYQAQAVHAVVPPFLPLIEDRDVAEILGVTVDWVRAHTAEIPGCERFGSYYRFHAPAIENWLGSLERLLEADAVAQLLKIPTSWVYNHADLIPGVMRLGRYLRFRPPVVRQFLAGTEACQ